ncbi:hypothetical protein [Arthrobacter sp. efr-133-TYG-118]|uniref:hypothetical protein n=1 Tax=Arthrobacter sp. efr-133-TYG-118 TaxID=3040279 RepID=UPI00254F26D8|nr:hypothetical protein [Arthrobacter sp. efr-133-TYG-118]
MDGETIRLIVVACGAIAAGLCGALIAGAFNSQNTLATIEGARVAAEAQREHEQELEQAQWLRERKVEVYTDHLAKLHELELAIAETKMDYRPSGAPPIATLSRNLSSTLSIRLFAPDQVQVALAELTKVVVSIMNVMQVSDAPERDALYEQATGLFNQKAGELERLIRQDLGVEEFIEETAV